MLNRPNQSKSKQQQAQTSQSKTTAKWKTYDDPVQIPILMYHAVHVMDPSEASNANLIVDPDLFEAQIKALSKAGYYFLTPEEAYKAFTENALPTKKVVWLTFDDGPNATTTNDVIDKLEKYDIVASFFLIGNNINDESAKAVKRAYDLGCEINNHSRTHSNMTELSAEDIRAEFEYTDEKVYEITGEHTKFFRPPYISVHQIVFDNIDVPFIAGIGANDWEDRVTTEMRAKMILKQAKDGDIILLHDAEGNSMTVEALDTIIPELQKQGYKFVTVTELFKIKGIEPDMEKVYTNVLQKNMYN